MLFYSEFVCAWLVQDIISNGMLLKYIHYVTTYSKYKYIMVYVTQNKPVNSHVVWHKFCGISHMDVSLCLWSLLLLCIVKNIGDRE